MTSVHKGLEQIITMKILALLFFVGLCQFSGYAQIPPITESQARKELSSRGITDEEFKARMREKGYDLDNIQPAQVPQLEGVIQATLNELEQEKSQNTQSDTKVPQKKLDNQAEEQAIEQKAAEQAQQYVEEIDEAVREGTSLEEAISEELSDAAKDNAAEAVIYGQDIFRNQSLEVYRSAKDIKPPSTYVLGPGDEIVVSIWGISQAEFAFTINEDGYIKPSQMSRIFLKGISLKKAEQLIQQRFSQYYAFQPEQFSLTVNTARTVTINIFGEVETYGSFTISAMNTAFNALVAAGGPTNIGTLRKIKLIRGRKTKIIDVYKFLFDPTVQYDFFLQNNDIIHVATSEKVVTINGAIKRPFRYELLEEEGLTTLIKFAGGLTVDAYQQNIQVTRILNEQKVIIDVNLNDLIANKKDFELKNGDLIKIRQIPGRLEEYTDIEGAVEFDGRYELIDSMRVSELLEKGTLREDARTDVAFLLRKMPDETVRLIKLNIDSILQKPLSALDIILQKKDKITILSQRNFTNTYQISVKGAVRRPISYPFDPTEQITVQDAILLAGGIEVDATNIGYIKRTDLNNSQKIDYIQVDIFAALADKNSPQNLVLKAKDQLTIYKTTRFTDAADVSVSGAVRDGGSYDYDENLTIADVVYLSGGLTQDATEIAYIKRRDLTNNKIIDYIAVDVFAALANPDSTVNIALSPKDELIIYSKERFSDAFNVSISGAVREPGTYDYDDNLTVADVVYLSGGLTNTAIDFAYILRTDYSNPKLVEYIRVNLEEALANPTSKENVILFPLDKIEIMSKAAFTDDFSVQIEGAVRNPGTFKFAESLKLKDVITKAGGFQLQAARNRIDIFRVQIKQNQPTRTIVATVEVDESFEVTSGQAFDLQPFDIIVVRNSPDFELQQSITLAGEVVFPGKYALIDDNEKLSSVIQRAGGLTTEAFPEGSMMVRELDQAGVVLLRLDKAIKHENSRFNYIMKAGDVVSIPKVKELVTINLGATLAAELYPDKMLSGGKFNVARKKGKRAGWYIEEYAAGIDKDKRARRRLITVVQPNGKIDKVTGLFSTPRVKKGSVINVGVKPEKVKKEKKEREPVDWGRVVSNGLALAASAMTVLVLATRL
ncbi:MAG: protein involved in polysaccharide export with SLBB domain [Saprospiraceae bacterium]|jgi:protein involved in polysaccharide export with SLBB domain